MRNLQLEKLLILSNSQESGNQFNFSKTYNLITAKNNSVGKSTLVKLILWAFGCEPQLDNKWKSTDSKTLISFNINGEPFRIIRDKNTIIVNDGKSNKVFTKITGDYSEYFANLVGFDVVLLDRSEESKLITPPPAFYFLPFYIDQKRSWNQAWNGFTNLSQISKWNPTVIKYHIGYLKSKHFELEKEKVDKQKEKSQLNIEVKNISNALEVVTKHTPSSEITLEESNLQSMTKEIQSELSNLAKMEEEYLSELSILTADKAYLIHEKSIAEHLIKELDDDYIFSVENISEETIECPLCGIVHENSLVNKASILTDKQQAYEQLEIIDKKLHRANNKISKLENDFETIKNKIDEINNKYVIEEEGTKYQLNKIIENFAYQGISKNIKKTKKDKLLLIEEKDSELKEIKKEQKALLTKEEKEEIETNFLTLLKSYIKILDAEGINLSKINSPLDYNKIIMEGGAAENTRGVLGYYLSIFTLIDIHGTEVKAPFIIDTPNQHEQSAQNYQSIIKLITQKVPKNEQVFICAMENENLKTYREKAHVITLDKKQLLLKSKYNDVKKIFDEMELLND